MTTLLEGKPVAAAIRERVAARVQSFTAMAGRPPGLVAVLVGDDPASRVYVDSKAKASAEAGIAGRALRLPATIDQARLDAEIDALNADPAVDGILVQLPLPGHLATREILERIDSDKDVDGFHPVNVGRLWADDDALVPATPSGIVEMLRHYGIELAGQRAVIVGRSGIVGKPMAALLLREQCTVTICHSRTRELAAVCRQADLLVAAIGRAGLIGPDHVRPGAVVVDVGMNRLSDPAAVERLFPGDEAKRRQLAEKGQVLTGDVDFRRVAPLAGAITPVPGGVGPLTVAMLLANTVRAAELRRERAGAS